MRRLTLILLILVLVVAACGGGDTAETPDDPLQLITEAAANIRQSDTFRLYVQQSGAPYFFSIAVGDFAQARFRLAEGQFVAPDQLQATASAVIGGLTVEVEIYADGINQFFRIPSLQIGWVNVDFAPGFNPATLIADDTGFEAAIGSLTDLEFVENTNLEDGQPVYHLRGMADGPAVTSLVVGLIEVEGQVPIDVFINRETIQPVRLVMTMPDTVTEEEPDPTVWTIDVFEINAEPALNPPDPSEVEETQDGEVEPPLESEDSETDSTDETDDTSGDEAEDSGA